MDVYKAGDQVRIHMPMDHHHGRAGVVESNNGDSVAVKFDDNARSFYRPEELKMEKAFEDEEDNEPASDYPELDVYSALLEITEKDSVTIERETAWKWASRACAAYQLASLTNDPETQFYLIDWADELEHEALEHAALVRDMGETVGNIQMAIGSYQNGPVQKSQPTSSQVHVPAMLGNEDEIMKTKAHNRQNLEELKEALKKLSQNLDRFLDEEEDEDVEKAQQKIPNGGASPGHALNSLAQSVRAPRQLPSRSSKRNSRALKDGINQDYTDPDTNPEMYPTLDNLEAEILKDAFDAADASDDNLTDGLYDMQQLVEGMDWELEHSTTIPEEAQAIAIQQLESDPDHYRKLRLQADGSDDVLTKDTNQTEEDPFSGEGFNLDLGSGQTRQPGYLGVDLYPYDYGTIVHDLHLGIPFPDGSASKVRMCNSLHAMDEMSQDPKPLLSEIHRVLMPGGQFLYEGPNEIYNYPQWAEDYPGFVLTNHEDGVEKDIDQEGYPVRQIFTRLATPDPATANDAEPRIGVAQYDMLPADALIATDALGYYWSDSTSSGRGNRLHGYPSQGALLNKKKSKLKKDQMASMNDDGNANAMTLPELQVQDAFDKTPVNPPRPPRIRKARTKWMRKGGPGSGPHPGSAGQEHREHEASIARDRAQNERKLQRIRERSAHNALAYANQAHYDSKKSRLNKVMKNGKIVPIMKMDQAKQIVYGVVLAPNEVDAQDDFMEPEDIEKTAHQYLSHSRVIGKNHSEPIQAEPVESFIAPEDFEVNGQYGPQPVKKGSWVLGVKVHDPNEWQKIVDGDYTGFSVGGVGARQTT